MTKFTLKNKSLNWNFDNNDYIDFKKNIWPSIDKVDGYLSISEAFFLYHTAKNLDPKSRSIDISQKKIVMEIGSYKGKSTVAIGKGLKLNKNKFKLICIDPILNKENEDNLFNEFTNNIKINQIDDIVEVLPFQSSEVIKNWEYDQGIAFLWIDGNHEYEYVSQDFLTWSKFLRPNGVVAFHDWYLLGVKETIIKYIFKSVFYNKIKVIDGNLISAIKYDNTPSRNDTANKKRVYYSLIFRNNILLIALLGIIFYFINKPFGSLINFLFSKPKIKKF